MLWAQVFGLHRGFVCDCGGVAEVTQMDHCHGPHSEACHHHEEEIPCHGEDDEHHDEAGTHEHAALIERLVAGNVIDMVTVPAPAASVIEMPVWLAVEPFWIGESEFSTVMYRDDVSRRRSWPEVLARTIALRI